MAKKFDRDDLLGALEEIGRAAQENDVLLHIAVYGGSALMLASNFRFSSEDVDIAELPKPWPQWLTAIVSTLGQRNGWSPDWLNEAVEFHLSRLATLAADHREFGSFPRSGDDPGLIVYVPTADYMLALKVKAIRVLDPLKGQQEAADIRNLMAVAEVTTPEAAIEIMARYFPRSASDKGKHLFLLKHILKDGDASDAPEYPV
jgi:hypothetical protein